MVSETAVGWPTSVGISNSKAFKMRNVPSSQALNCFNARTAAERSDIAILRPASNAQTLKSLNSQRLNLQRLNLQRLNLQRLNLQRLNPQSLNLQRLNPQRLKPHALQHKKSSRRPLPLALGRVRERYF